MWQLRSYCKKIFYCISTDYDIIRKKKKQLLYNKKNRVFLQSNFKTKILCCSN